jgi:hypothetical protein
MTTFPSGTFDQYQEHVEQRTSVMAILSLVCSLICIIPGAAVLGALFGVGALVAIANSRERLSGSGLAIAGLIISLIVLAIQVGIVVGGVRALSEFDSMFAQPISTSMVAIEQGDYTTARTVLTPEGSARVRDADFEAFRDEYQGELGSFQGIPKGWDLVSSYLEIGPMMQQMQGQNNAIPFPATFSKGTGIIVFQIDPTNAGGGGSAPLAVNLLILAPSGAKWTLYDPKRPGATSPDATAPAPVPTAEPSAVPDEKPDAREPAPDPAPAGPG